MSKIIFSLIVLTSLIWVACNTNKKQPADEEVETPASTESDSWDQRLHDIWVLTNLNGEDLEIGTPRPQLELFPEDGRVGGKGACNRLFGQMKARERSITFTQLGTTKMHCGEHMARETKFLQELERAERYLVREGELMIFWGDQLTLTFKKVD